MTTASSHPNANKQIKKRVLKYLPKVIIVVGLRYRVMLSSWRRTFAGAGCRRRRWRPLSAAGAVTSRRPSGHWGRWVSVGGPQAPAVRGAPDDETVRRRKLAQRTETHQAEEQSYLLLQVRRSLSAGHALQ